MIYGGEFSRWNMSLVLRKFAIFLKNRLISPTEVYVYIIYILKRNCLKLKEIEVWIEVKQLKIRRRFWESDYPRKNISFNHFLYFKWNIVQFASRRFVPNSCDRAMSVWITTHKCHNQCIFVHTKLKILCVICYLITFWNKSTKKLIFLSRIFFRHIVRIFIVQKQAKLW